MFGKLRDASEAAMWHRRGPDAAGLVGCSSDFIPALWWILGRGRTEWLHPLFETTWDDLAGSECAWHCKPVPHPPSWFLNGV